MLLYVMRHGPAEDRSASGRDADRRLTGPGREAVLRVAELLRASRGSPVARIVSSPLVRARETAEIVWRHAGDAARPVEHHDDLSTEADTPVELAVAVARGGLDAILVGHNPNVEALVRDIAHAPRGFAGFRTATIAAIEVAADAVDEVGRWPLLDVLIA